MKKLLFGIIAPVASMISVLATPFELAADQCCPPPECCNPCDECCDDGWMQYLGLALVAAGAGALAGWGTAEAVSSKGKHGRPGIPGPTGPSSFHVTVATDTLTALPTTIAVGDLNSGITGPGATITPFITTPNGSVYSGAAVAIPLAAGLTPTVLVWPTVPAGAVVVGDYEFGVLIASPTGVTVTSLDVGALAVTVVASAESPITTAIQLPFPFVPVLPNTELQVAAPFTYNAPAFP